MKKTLATTLCFFASVAVAEAHHFNDGGVHWAATSPTSQERTLNVADCVGSRWDTPLRRAISSWNSSRYISMRVVGCSQPHQIKVRQASLSGTGSRTNYSWSGNHFKRAEVTLNTNTYDGNERKISCHELGHAIGLDHRSERSSCMRTPVTSAVPESHDYTALRIAYSHRP